MSQAMAQNASKSNVSAGNGAEERKPLKKLFGTVGKVHPIVNNVNGTPMLKFDMQVNKRDRSGTYTQWSRITGKAIDKFQEMIVEGATIGMAGEYSEWNNPNPPAGMDGKMRVFQGVSAWAWTPKAETAETGSGETAPAAKTSAKSTPETQEQPKEEPRYMPDLDDEIPF